MQLKEIEENMTKIKNESELLKKLILIQLLKNLVHNPSWIIISIFLN